MSHPALARAAQFQAGVYYSLLLFAILLLIVLATGYALAGIRAMWRSGERGPAAVLLPRDDRCAEGHPTAPFGHFWINPLAYGLRRWALWDVGDIDPVHLLNRCQ